MSGWTYSAHKLDGRTGTSTILDPDLPLRGVSITNVLSGSDTINGSIAPAVARLVGPDGRPIIRKWSTAIMATDPGGEIRAGCIVTGVTRNPASEELNLQCLGFVSAINGQPYAGQRYFVKEDPLTIIRHIWDHWQSQPLGNLGLTLDRTTATPHRIGTTLKQVEFDTQNGPVEFESGPFKLLDYETDDLGREVDSLAEKYDIDFIERHAWNADGTLRHSLDFGYPRLGRRRDDLRFVVGENVTVKPSVVDSAYASAVLVRGAGEGPTTLRKWAVRANEDRLRRIHVVDNDTLKFERDLLSLGQSTLGTLAGKPNVTQIVVRDHPHAPIGSWEQGDEITLETDDEWGDDSITARILSTTYSPEDYSVATLNVETQGTVTE